MPSYRIGCPLPASLRADARLPAELVHELTTGHAGALQALLGDGWRRSDGCLDHPLPAPGQQVMRGVLVRVGYAGDVDELGELPAVLPLLVEVAGYERTTFPFASLRALGVTIGWIAALVLAAGLLVRLATGGTALAITSSLATFIVAIAATVRTRGWLEQVRWRRTPPRLPLTRWPLAYTGLQLLAATFATALVAGVPLLFAHAGLAVIAQLALLGLLLLTGRAPHIVTEPSPAVLADQAAATTVVDGYLRDPRHGFTPLDAGALPA